MNNELLNQFLSAAIAVAVPALFFLGRMLYEQLRLQLEGSKYSLILDICHSAVKYAEQEGLDKKLEVAGDQKLNWAIEHAQSEIEKYGVEIELEPLVRIIKAAVLDEFNREKGK